MKSVLGVSESVSKRNLEVAETTVKEMMAKRVSMEHVKGCILVVGVVFAVVSSLSWQRNSASSAILWFIYVCIYYLREINYNKKANETNISEN